MKAMYSSHKFHIKEPLYQILTIILEILIIIYLGHYFMQNQLLSVD